MSLFKNFKSDGLEETKDQLGGFAAIDTGIYLATIKAFYAGNANSGALNVTVVADLESGQEYRETIYVSNKSGENFFVKNNKKSPLPGFTTINDIALLAADKELHELEDEEKVVKIYDYASKSEVNTAVPMFTELLGKQVYLGIVKQLVNKNVKNDATGKYEPTAETREENVIDKVFHAEFKVTVPEARAKKTEPAFYDAWLKRNEGETRDRRTLKDGQAPAKGGTPPKAGAKGAEAPAARKSLFSK